MPSVRSGKKHRPRGPAISIAVLCLIGGLTSARTHSAPAAQSREDTQRTCDRACLDGFADRYLKALKANDPSGLPVTPGVKFTEDGQRLQLGDGLWNTATGDGTYKFYMEDIEAQEVAFFGTMREAGEPIILALRLKIAGIKIAEIETIVERTVQYAENLEKRGKPDALFTQTISPAERLSRADLAKVANKYFSGVQLNDGKGDYPFTDDCDRWENGTEETNNHGANNTYNPVTAQSNGVESRPGHRSDPSYSSRWGCKQQFQSGLIHFVTRVRDRRFIIVDPERGVALAFTFFDHAAGKTRTFKIPDGTTVTAGPTTPWTWEIAEVFRVEHGKIRRIEAVYHRCPYGMNSGWSAWRDSMSTQARVVPPLN
jgi:hypothetical protein